jgi:UDP-N-acetylglucosamine 1-carboxyvinyltransferase
VDKIVIWGGERLQGEVQISGAKNAALPILVSSLLTEGWNTFKNVPDLRDIKTIKRLLNHMGARCKTLSPGVIQINSDNITRCEAPYEMVKTMRASILVLGPLVARLGQARVSLPGGCAIGARPVNLHINALERMGAKITLAEGYLEAKAKRLRGAKICFDISTVTGTENIMMAACMAEGETILENAAKEPEIVNLAQVLNAMGAKVSGAGTDVLRIDGVDKLHAVNAEIIPDRIEAGTFIIAAGITAGDVVIKGCVPGHLDALIKKLTDTGMEITPVEGGLRAIGRTGIRSVDVMTLPYPGFPTDLQAQIMAYLALANGSSLISETVFENRFMHVSELQRMGRSEEHTSELQSL